MKEYNYEIYAKICKRARDMGIAQGDGLTQLMDMACADRVFCMDWNGLLEADDFNFAHDFCGIQNNIDREAEDFDYSMFNYFEPRYSR